MALVGFAMASAIAAGEATAQPAGRASRAPGNVAPAGADAVNSRAALEARQREVRSRIEELESQQALLEKLRANRALVAAQASAQGKSESEVAFELAARSGAMRDQLNQLRGEHARLAAGQAPVATVSRGAPAATASTGPAGAASGTHAPGPAAASTGRPPRGVGAAARDARASSGRRAGAPAPSADTGDADVQQRAKALQSLESEFQGTSSAAAARPGPQGQPQGYLAPAGGTPSPSAGSTTGGAPAAAGSAYPGGMPGSGVPGSPGAMPGAGVPGYTGGVPARAGPGYPAGAATGASTYGAPATGASTFGAAATGAPSPAGIAPGTGAAVYPRGGMPSPGGAGR